MPWLLLLEQYDARQILTLLVERIRATHGVSTSPTCCAGRRRVSNGNHDYIGK
ncbi:MAG TPA: hypothetical protein VF173_35300 [Thermoanaerobaculia bacterium]|nr:hypothetical protein [Thermoanaerobaculia bacterium]